MNAVWNGQPVAGACSHVRPGQEVEPERHGVGGLSATGHETVGLDVLVDERLTKRARPERRSGSGLAPVRGLRPSWPHAVRARRIRRSRSGSGNRPGRAGAPEGPSQSPSWYPLFHKQEGPAISVTRSTQRSALSYFGASNPASPESW